MNIAKIEHICVVAIVVCSLSFVAARTSHGQQAKTISATATAEVKLTEQPQDPTDPDKDRIDRLATYLTKTRWTGQFTVTGADQKPPAPEYYEILEAHKAETGDYWNLVARIKYGDKDATLPLPPIEIKWAGETPVITVDRVTVPGFGTFDARVLIRRGQYAGTWSHDQVGGHLFGTIEKMEDQDEGKPEENTDRN